MHRQPARLIAHGLLTLSLLLAGACATPFNQSASTVRLTKEAADAGTLTQAELQQDLQRFTVNFMDRIAQNLDDEHATRDPTLRYQLIRRALLYDTAAMEIATEPSPEIGLLDMLVFITLSRDSQHRYWNPVIFKEHGDGFAHTFDRSYEEIWTIADKVATPEVKAKFKGYIARWQKEHPDEYRTEGVRMTDFSKIAGRIEKEREDTTTGLLANVASGIVAVDNARLFGDRAMFLAQRMPFLFRMQAALATSEIMTTIDTRLASDGELRGTLDQANNIFGSLTLAARETKQMAQAFYPLFLPTNTLANRTLSILDKIQQTAPSGIKTVDDFFKRLFTYGIIFGILMVIVWWSGYYIVRRRLIKETTSLRVQPTNVQEFRPPEPARPEEDRRSKTYG